MSAEIVKRHESARADEKQKERQICRVAKKANFEMSSATQVFGTNTVDPQQEPQSNRPCDREAVSKSSGLSTSLKLKVETLTISTIGTILVHRLIYL